jgi:hypothetical protein
MKRQNTPWPKTKTIMIQGQCGNFVVQLKWKDQKCPCLSMLYFSPPRAH